MNQEAIRRVARSDEWQTLYNSAKELGNIRLFDNDKDLSHIQIWFLHWLAVYSSLYQDLAINEEYISAEIINDSIRSDAYLLYRQEKRKDLGKDKSKSNKKDTPLPGVPSVVFTSK